jgi:hypothetical protein
VILDKVKENLSEFPLDDFLLEIKDHSHDEKVLWSELWRKAYLFSPDDFLLPKGDTSDISGLPLLFAWSRKQGLCRPYLLGEKKQERVQRSLENIKPLLPTIAYPELWVMEEGPLLDEVRLLSERNNPAWSFSPFALLRFTVLLDPGHDHSEATILHEALHAAIDEFVSPGEDLLASDEARSFNEDFIQLLVAEEFALDLGPLAPFRRDKEFLLELTSLYLMDEIGVVEGF